MNASPSSTPAIGLTALCDAVRRQLSQLTTGMRHRLRPIIAAAFAAGLVAGCSSMKIEDFKSGKPEFRLETYFSGKSKAWGLFEDRFGTVQAQFVVDITGVWDGNRLILTEDFRYASGETEQRVWTLWKTGANTYAGTAAGVVGEAKGEVAGNAFHMAYTFDMKIGDSTWRVHFDDWMFLQEDGVVMNRAEVTKWGLHVGTATIFFKRAEKQAAVNENQPAAVAATMPLAARAAAPVQ